MNENKEHDVLDDIKQAEKQLKVATLVKNIATLKKIAKDVLTAKEKMNQYLEQMGMSETDSKRIIDFINSLPEITLSKKEIKDIEDDVAKDLENKTKEVKKKIEDSNLTFYNLGSKIDNLQSGSLNQWPIVNAINNTTTSSLCFASLNANGEFEIVDGESKLSF